MEVRLQIKMRGLVQTGSLENWTRVRSINDARYMTMDENNMYSRIRLCTIVGCLLLSASITNAQQAFGDAKKNDGPENNKIQIRSGLRVTKSARQPVIKIELYSDRVFPALNAAVVLVVGKRVFQGGGYGDTEGH